MTFGTAKLRGLLLAGTFNVLANYLLRLADSAVAGNLIGADALAGVNLVAPLVSGVTFIAALVGSGTVTNYQLAMGRLDRLRARQFFTQGLWSALAFGGLFALAIAFGGCLFLDRLGAGPVVTGHAVGYLRWFVPVPPVECVSMLLAFAVIADGDSRLCMGAFALNFAVKLAVSVAGVKLGMGVGACALGTLCSDLACIAVLAVHFVRKCNTLRLAWHFSVLDSWRIAVASFGDAASYLCDSLLFLFLNFFAILRFGPDLLPVVAVAAALWGFLEIFNGVGNAIQPLVTVYFGEGNAAPVHAVMKTAAGVAVAEGLVLAALFLAWPGLPARTVGIADPGLLAASSVAVRSMCVGFVALALAGLFNSYYMFVERPLLAGIVTFLGYLVFPVACIAAGSLTGVTGMWLGFGIGPVAALVTIGLWIVSVSGRRAFPLLLPEGMGRGKTVFDLRLDEREIAAVSEKVGALPGVPMRAALMVEEVFMVVRERAGGRRLLGEVTVEVGEKDVSLTLRDDGEIFDITDADARISSLRGFLVASVMERQLQRLNFVTSGFNRNIFKFDRRAAG